MSTSDLSLRLRMVSVRSPYALAAIRCRSLLDDLDHDKKRREEIASIRARFDELKRRVASVTMQSRSSFKLHGSFRPSAEQPRVRKTAVREAISIRADFSSKSERGA
jgi:hypothetical protein